MKGLVRNNIYSIDEIFKTLIGMMGFALISIVFTNIFAEQMPNATQLTDIAMLATIGAFSSVSLEMLKNGAMSKWSRFELTTPVAKADVITGRYLTYLLFAAVSTVFLTLGFVIPIFFGQSFDANWYTYYLTMLFCFNFLTPAISHPLILKLGIDKAIIIFLISTMCGLGLFIAPTIIFADFLATIPNVDFVYRVTISTICLVSFGLSYLISKKMYVKMDL